MFQRPIPMNEEGASPGGGASPAPVESPAATQGAAVPTIDLNAIKGAVAEAFGELRNGLFADLRKTGALDKPKPSPTAPAAASVPVEAPGAPGPAPGMTAADLHRELARDRAFFRATDSAGLTDEQARFVEETYRAVNPPDPATWATTFLKTMGLGPKSPPTQASAPVAAPALAANPSQPSFTDKGPAASSVARDPLAIIQNDPRKANSDDFRRLVAQHGQAKASEMWRKHTMAFLETVKVRPDGRR
jgi:hypothetical protein